MSTPEATDSRGHLADLAKLVYSATNGPQRPLDHLETVAAATWLLDQARDELVAAARREGASWAQIGSALGISRQGARQRWGLTSDDDPTDPDQPELWPFEPTARRAHGRQPSLHVPT